MSHQQATRTQDVGQPRVSTYHKLSKPTQESGTHLMLFLVSIPHPVMGTTRDYCWYVRALLILRSHFYGTDSPKLFPL